MPQKTPTTVRLTDSLRDRLDEYVEDSDQLEDRAQAIRTAIRRFLDE